MTVRFLMQWNGYSPDAIRTFSASEESRLVSLGFASLDLDGAAEDMTQRTSKHAAEHAAMGNIVTADVNPVTRRVGFSAGSGKVLGLNPAVQAIRDALKNEQATHSTDYAYRAPLLDGAALPLNSSVLIREIYTSGGKVWATTTAGTTGATGPVAGANVANPVAAGAGTARFMYLCEKRTAIVGDPDTPEVTYVRPNSLAGVSSYMVVDAGAGGSADNIGLYTYTGSLQPVIRATAAMPGRFTNGSTWYGSTAIASLIGYDQQTDRSIGFATRSKRVFIAGPANYAPAMYGIEINGKPLYDLGVLNAPNTLAGGHSGVLLTFATRELRTFWFRPPYDAEFGGVIVDAGERISKPLISDVRLTFEGDSLTENSANPGALYRGGSWSSKLGRRLGIRHTFNAAVGGTGFVSVGANNVPLTHPKRMQVVIDSAPDMIIVGGAHNDNSYTSAQRIAAMTLWYSTIRAALPGTMIVFFGTTPLYGELYATLSAVDTDIEAVVDAAIAAGDNLVAYLPTADESLARWVPDGTAGPYYTTTMGDAHPSQHGIDYLAERYTAALCDLVTRILRD